MITPDNVVRMKAGMPLDINIQEITPPGKRMGRVLIHYAATHADGVRDMERDGLPVTDKLRESAKKLDDELQQERQARGRSQ